MDNWRQCTITISVLIRWKLYHNQSCIYILFFCFSKVKLPSGDETKIVWRCSARFVLQQLILKLKTVFLTFHRLSDWRASRVESIDFSTMILGYSTNFVTIDFFKRYAA